MHKVLSKKGLRLSCARSDSRRGFSLAELVVAVAILALMLALTGQVFTITSQSTGQAKALTKLTQSLRGIERVLRADLSNVEAGQSLILIYANPINAYWTREGMDADDDGDPSTDYPHPADPERESRSGNGILEPPRADILMIFTNRREQRVIKGEPTVINGQQVVYGHADLGEYRFDATAERYEFTPDPPAFEAVLLGADSSNLPVSPVPSGQWHLARRSVSLVNTPPDDPQSDWAFALDADDDTEPYGSILKGSTDVVWDFDYRAQVWTPQYDTAPVFWPVILTGGSVPYARSQLDLTPPAVLANRLGHYFLPRCVSFKVEWALDPDSEFVGGRLDYEKEIHWLDPGDLADADVEGDVRDPLAALEAARVEAEMVSDERYDALTSLLEDQLGAGEYSYSLRERFTDTGDEEWMGHSPTGRADFVVFAAQRLVDNEADSKPIAEDIFPAALRITVDVFDEGHRLERPIRHVMVIPVGGKGG